MDVVNSSMQYIPPWLQTYQDSTCQSRWIINTKCIDPCYKNSIRTIENIGGRVLIYSQLKGPISFEVDYWLLSSIIYYDYMGNINICWTCYSEYTISIFHLVISLSSNFGQVEDNVWYCRHSFCPNGIGNGLLSRKFTLAFPGFVNGSHSVTTVLLLYFSDCMLRIVPCTCIFSSVSYF